MSRKQCLALVAMLTLVFGGCGGSQESDQPSGDPSAPAKNGTGDSAASLGATPEAAVQEILEAFRLGDDARTMAILTEKANQEWSARGGLQPTASDTATFEIGRVEDRGEDGAWVATTWTDMDPQGQPMTEQAVWMVRREAAGWRIQGVAQEVFPDEDPLLLDYEKPDEVAQKLQWVQTEIERRYQAEQAQASRVQNPENSIQR